MTDLRGLGNASALAKAGIIGLGVFAVGKVVNELGELAMEVQHTASAFQMLEAGGNRLAASVGGNLDDMVDDMRDASRGMIADTDLILSANRAMMLGVADTTEEMVALMNVAAERGQAMGLTMTQAFNDIVTGLGRGSALILDNLGIVLDLEQEYRNYAAELGTTASALDEAQKKQAMVNAVLHDAKGGVEVMVDPTQSLAASWQNFRTQVALFISENTPLPDLLTDIAEGVQDVNETMEEQRETGLSVFETRRIEAIGYKLAEAQRRYTNAVRVYGEESQEATDIAREMNNLMLLLVGSYDTGVISLDRYVDSITRVSDESIQAANDLAVLRSEFEATAMALREGMPERVMDIALDITGGDILGAYRQAGELSNQIIDEANQLMYEGNLTLEVRDNIIIPALINKYREMNRATHDHASAVAHISDEYSSLQSAVESVLSTALDVGVGVDPEDILGRADAVNENARRLADVAVHGWESPWAEYFRNEFPELWAEAFSDGGDIQRQAATLLQQFEQGLRPELIDKELAKERVRIMLLGDQNMAELAREIATELSEEMGVSMYEAMGAAGAVLGVGGEEQGQTAARAFADGAVAQMQETNAGSAMVDTFLSQAKAMYERIRQAGRDAGEQWGSGFLETARDGVLPELTDMLVRLVTPGVAADIAREHTMTGAE